MTLMETLLARHSTRKFTGEKTPREYIEQIARAGLTGPVGRNKKPWKLVAVDDVETIEKLSAARTPRQGIFDTTTAVIAVFGVFSAIVIYGGIMNPASVLMWANTETLTWKVLLTYYVTGFPLDCVHAAATAFFLWIAAEPLLEKLDRIKRKYGLME